MERPAAREGERRTAPPPYPWPVVVRVVFGCAYVILVLTGYAGERGLALVGRDAVLGRTLAFVE